MYYYVIKKYYKKDVSVIYMDTYSFLLKSNGIDILDEFAKGPLAKFMNFNNFEINKGKLGLLKSETGSIPKKESICL